jgi:nucleoside-diphosphate-sugar epimerase
MKGGGPAGRAIVSLSRMAASAAPLTVAVTGPTGTFGFGLMPLLQADDRIGAIVGIARRPFDPAEYGWTKMEYRRGDVRQPDALADAFRGADIVVHLAFMITGGTLSRETIRAINIDGTLNVFRAAAAAGVQRFVYASSVAAYGFHRDNPERITEEWPTRPGARLFYAREKAQIERLLQIESRTWPELDLYLLRPPIVLGPHAVGAKELLPEPLAGLGRHLGALVRSSPVPLPALVPSLPVQFIHEDDVGQAFLQCIVAAGPPGAYNITGDGVVTGTDVARELGLAALPFPAGLTRAAARALTPLSQLPFLPQPVGWVEAATQPSIMDASKAKRELDWRPRYTSLEALRDTIAGR